MYLKQETIILLSTYKLDVTETNNVRKSIFDGKKENNEIIFKCQTFENCCNSHAIFLHLSRLSFNRPCTAIR